MGNTLQEQGLVPWILCQQFSNRKDGSKLQQVHLTFRNLLDAECVSKLKHPASQSPKEIHH